jgi:hypothetical protein
METRESSASRSGRFTAVETDPGTNSIGGCVGTRTGQDALGKNLFLLA